MMDPAERRHLPLCLCAHPTLTPKEWNYFFFPVIQLSRPTVWRIIGVSARVWVHITKRGRRGRLAQTSHGNVASSPGIQVQQCPYLVFTFDLKYSRTSPTTQCGT